MTAVNTPPQIYIDLGKWQQDTSVKSLIETNEMQEFYPTLYDEVKETPDNFRILGDLEPTTENYQEQLINLATGEIYEKDTNFDGSISKSEYITASLQDYAQTMALLDSNSADGAIIQMTEEDIAGIATDAFLLFDELDKTTFNAETGETTEGPDGKIGILELVNFYMNNDKFENGELTDVIDGKIGADSIMYVDYLLSQVPEENRQMLFDMYFANDNLMYHAIDDYLNAYDEAIVQ